LLLRDDGGFIRLAQVPPFRWGAALVDPPRRRISCGDRGALLEPRIMQVLVVLAEARGAVISRDELIERCWGGRIVGENAINRVISRIRQLPAELGTDDIQLETITKVGYRMLVPEPVEAPTLWPEGGAREAVRIDPDPRPWSRRGILAGAGALIGLAAAGTWLARPRGHVPHPEAV